MNRQAENIFEKMPIFEAVLRLGVPTIAGQIILVIYNIADTYFIGLTNSDMKLAAVTVCLPAFMFLSAISNLFGVGGGASVSRALGLQEKRRASGICSFSFWGCIAVTAVYSAAVFAFRREFIFLLGGHDHLVAAEAEKYITATVVCGGLFTSIGPFLSHMLRSEGRAVHASIGIALGGITNIILDPIFMFVLLPRGSEVLGAAIATALSNLIACIYFTLVILAIRNQHSILYFGFRAMTTDMPTIREIILTGLPACLMTLCENISYAVLDHLMALEGMVFQAAVGVAKKVNMLSHCIARGMAQGVLPMLAYCFSAEKYKRLKSVLKTSAFMSVGVAACISAVCLIFGRELIGVFINTDGLSLGYGTSFLRILCIGGPFSAFAYAMISFYQAIRESGKSLLLALCRKGILDIPLMLMLSATIRVFGIVWATPLADILCCLLAVYMYRRTFRYLNMLKR